MHIEKRAWPGGYCASPLFKRVKKYMETPFVISANLAELPLLLLVSYAREHMQQGSGEKVTLSSEHLREDLRSYQLGLG